MSIQLIVTKAIVYLVKAITTLASRVCVMIARSVKHLVASESRGVLLDFSFVLVFKFWMLNVLK